MEPQNTQNTQRDTGEDRTKYQANDAPAPAASRLNSGPYEFMIHHQPGSPQSFGSARQIVLPS
jgi:hypothetical protein